jgi:hypothetical protein
MAKEILHQLEIAQDNRVLSFHELWHSLALASLLPTVAHL